MNFRQATIFWIIFLCLIVFLFLDLYFLIQNGESGLYLLLLGLVLLWLIFTFVYFYPLLVRFDNKLLRHVRNAFLLSLTHLGRTICLTALALAPLLIWMVSGSFCSTPRCSGCWWGSPRRPTARPCSCGRSLPPRCPRNGGTDPFHSRAGGGAPYSLHIRRYSTCPNLLLSSWPPGWEAASAV